MAYKYDGGTPTAATKQTLDIGDILKLTSVADMTNFKAIGIGGTSNLAVTYGYGAST